MPIIERIRCSIGGRMLAAGAGAVGAERPPVLPRTPQERMQFTAGRELRRIMAAAGVESLGDVDRFTEAQVARMCEGKRPEERIRIKQLIDLAGLYPRAPRLF